MDNAGDLRDALTGDVDYTGRGPVAGRGSAAAPGLGHDICDGPLAGGGHRMRHAERRGWEPPGMRGSGGWMFSPVQVTSRGRPSITASAPHDDIPDLLRETAAGSEEALEELGGYMVHQGTLYLVTRT